MSVEQWLEALEELKGKPTDDRIMLAPWLYTPDPLLESYIEEFERFLQDAKPTPERRQWAGYTLERIAYLAFRSLWAHESIKSFRSVGPQLDLLVNGSETAWLTLCAMLRVSTKRRGILVEAKAKEKPVGDADVERLCGILRHHFRKTVGLGVLFTVKGITGGTKTRVLSDARYTQTIFYHGTRVPLIVLTWPDIRELSRPGSLPRILESKIRALEEQATPPTHPGACQEIELPQHLADLGRREHP